MINKKSFGFTLLELMIVVAVIGIIATFAYPSYQESIKKSRRADAKGALMAFAGAMEKRFTLTNNYCDAGGADGTSVSDCGTATNDTGTSTIFAPCSPVDVRLDEGTTCDTTTSEVYYKLTINTVTPSTSSSAASFKLYATPIKQQADDKCGTLILDSTGKRDLIGASSGIQVKDCW